MQSPTLTHNLCVTLTSDILSTADSPSARQEPMDAQPLSDLDVTRSSDRHPLGYQQTDQADHSTWADSSRCYLPDLHAAECKVTSCLVRMAASPRQQIIGGEERIVKWLGKLEQEEGKSRPCPQQSPQGKALCLHLELDVIFGDGRRASPASSFAGVFCVPRLALLQHLSW